MKEAGKIAVLCLFLLASSCLNPYEESFMASTLDTSPISEDAYVQVIETNAIEVALKKYQAEGYEVIGRSDFDGSRALINEENKIEEAARKVGATLVIYGSFFSRIDNDYNSYSRQTYYHRVYKKEAFFLRKKEEPEASKIKPKNSKQKAKINKSKKL